METFGQTFQSGEVVLGDWFPRGGDNAVARVQCIDQSGSSVDATVSFLTKNEEDIGDGSSVLSIDVGGGADEALSPPGIATKLSEGQFKELIRVKVSCVVGWVTLQVFPLVFFDSAKAP